MKGHQFEKQQRFSIRKFSVGVCSALIGLAFLGAGAVSADEKHATNEQPLEASTANTEDVNHLIRESGVYTADAVLSTTESAKPVEEATPATTEVSPSSTEASTTTDSLAQTPRQDTAAAPHREF